VGADAGTRPEANQIASACFGVVIHAGHPSRRAGAGPAGAVHLRRETRSIPEGVIYYQYRHRRRPIPNDLRKVLNQDLRRPCALISAKLCFPLDAT
jgi:hypothetical protein